jgi:hypothetical protein
MNPYFDLEPFLEFLVDNGFFWKRPHRAPNEFVAETVGGPGEAKYLTLWVTHPIASMRRDLTGDPAGVKRFVVEDQTKSWEKPEYFETDDLEKAIKEIVRRKASLHRGEEAWKDPAEIADGFFVEFYGV